MRNKNFIVRCLLYLPSIIYGMATSLRNMLFDWKILPSERFPVPVICIGNLSVGGTGKTPFTEYLVRLLKGRYRVAVLSRGYKRKTRGYILAKDDCTVEDVGDEACQMKHKFPEILVAVDANRRRGIRNLLELPEKEVPEVILLDDALQHRYVVPSLIIILSDYNHIFYNDKMLPYGRLRESSFGIYRADIIVITKCNSSLMPIDLRLIDKHIEPMAHQSISFSGIKYMELEGVYPEKALQPCSVSEIGKDEHVLLIAGIANPQPLIDLLGRHTEHLSFCQYPDHHYFTKKDIEKIDAQIKKMETAKLRIICTEKDAMRLKGLEYLPEEWKGLLYYIPISVEFLYGKGVFFDERILKHVLSTIKMNKTNAKN